MAYGIDVLPSNDPYINLAERALEGMAAAVRPGAFLVETIPLLRHVPTWFPGAKFKRDAQMWTQWANEMLEVPFAAALDDMVCLCAFQRVLVSCSCGSWDRHVAWLPHRLLRYLWKAC